MNRTKLKCSDAKAKFTCSLRVVTASDIQIVETKNQIRTDGFEVSGAGHIYVVSPTFEEKLSKDSTKEQNQIEDISQSTDFSWSKS